MYLIKSIYLSINQSIYQSINLSIYLYSYKISCKWSYQLSSPGGGILRARSGTRLGCWRSRWPPTWSAWWKIGAPLDVAGWSSGLKFGDFSMGRFFFGFTTYQTDHGGPGGFQK